MPLLLGNNQVFTFYSPAGWSIYNKSISVFNDQKKGHKASLPYTHIFENDPYFPRTILPMASACFMASKSSMGCTSPARLWMVSPGAQAASAIFHISSSVVTPHSSNVTGSPTSRQKSCTSSNSSWLTPSRTSWTRVPKATQQPWSLCFGQAAVTPL